MSTYNHTLAHIYRYNIHIPVSYFLLLLTLILFTVVARVESVSLHVCTATLELVCPTSNGSMVFQDHPVGGATSSPTGPTEFGPGHPTIFQHGPISQENIGVFPGFGQDESRVPELALQFQRTARWPRESDVSHLRTLPKMAASA